MIFLVAILIIGFSGQVLLSQRKLDHSREAAYAGDGDNLFWKTAIIPAKPLTFAETSQLVSDNRVPELGRSKVWLAWGNTSPNHNLEVHVCSSFSQEGLEAYHRWRDKELARWLTITDLVMYTVFGYHREIDPSSNLWRAVRPKQKGAQIVLRKNDFPYYFEGLYHPEHEEPAFFPKRSRDPSQFSFLTDGLEHWLLWFEDVQPLSSLMVDRLIEQQPALSGCDIIYWVNPRQRQSVKEIQHVQIVSRCPATEGEQLQRRTLFVARNLPS